MLFPLSSQSQFNGEVSVSLHKHEHRHFHEFYLYLTFVGVYELMIFDGIGKLGLAKFVSTGLCVNFEIFLFLVRIAETFEIAPLKKSL